jgi:four helix bundle protein
VGALSINKRREAMTENGRFGNFEQLDAWQLSRSLTTKVYSITHSDKMSRDYGFKDQIRRASVSVMNNIAEGYERGSRKEYAHFLFIARGSAGEVRSMFYVAKDLGYIDEKLFNELQALSIRVSKTIWGLIRSVKPKE